MYFKSSLEDFPEQNFLFIKIDRGKIFDYNKLVSL